VSVTATTSLTFLLLALWFRWWRNLNNFVHDVRGGDWRGWRKPGVSKQTTPPHQAMAKAPWPARYRTKVTILQILENFSQQKATLYSKGYFFACKVRAGSP